MLVLGRPHVAESTAPTKSGVSWRDGPPRIGFIGLACLSCRPIARMIFFLRAFTAVDTLQAMTSCSMLANHSPVRFSHDQCESGETPELGVGPPRGGIPHRTRYHRDLPSHVTRRQAPVAPQTKLLHCKPETLLDLPPGTLRGAQCARVRRAATPADSLIRLACHVVGGLPGGDGNSRGPVARPAALRRARRAVAGGVDSKHGGGAVRSAAGHAGAS